MTSDENLQRLKNISERIENIYKLCDFSGNIIAAVEDKAFSEPAILMHIQICKENFEKIIYSGDDISVIFSKQTLRSFKAIKSLLNGDFGDINSALLESIVRNNLPKIKENIDEYFLGIYKQWKN